MRKNAIRGTRCGQCRTSAAHHAFAIIQCSQANPLRKGHCDARDGLYLIPGRESIYFGEVHLLRCDIKSVIKLVQHAGWTYEVIISL